MPKLRSITEFGILNSQTENIYDTNKKRDKTKWKKKQNKRRRKKTKLKF